MANIKYIPSRAWPSLTGEQLQQYKAALKKGEVEFPFLTPSQIRSLSKEEKNGYDASYDKHNIVFKTPSEIFEMPEAEQNEYIRLVSLDFESYARFMQKQGCETDENLRKSLIDNQLKQLLERKENQIKPLEKDLARIKRQLMASVQKTDKINMLLSQNLRYNLGEAQDVVKRQYGLDSQEYAEFCLANNGRLIDKFRDEFRDAVKKNNLQKVQAYIKTLEQAGASEYVLCEVKQCEQEVAKRLKLKEELSKKTKEKNILEQQLDAEYEAKKTELEAWDKVEKSKQDCFMKEANKITDKVKKYTFNSIMNSVLVTGAAVVLSALTGSLPIVIAVGLGTYVTTNIGTKIYRERFPKRAFKELGEKYGKQWFQAKQTGFSQALHEDESNLLDLANLKIEHKEDSYDLETILLDEPVEETKPKKAPKKQVSRKKQTNKNKQEEQESSKTTTVEEEMGVQVDEEIAKETAKKAENEAKLENKREELAAKGYSEEMINAQLQNYANSLGITLPSQDNSKPTSFYSKHNTNEDIPTQQ